MKLKLISNGTTAGTQLIDQESGEMLHLVQNLHWSVSAEDGFIIPTVTFNVLNVPIAVCINAKIITFKYNTELEKYEKDSECEKLVNITSVSNEANSYIEVVDVETGKAIGEIKNISIDVDVSVDTPSVVIEQYLFISKE